MVSVAGVKAYIPGVTRHDMCSILGDNKILFEQRCCVTSVVNTTRVDLRLSCTRALTKHGMHLVATLLSLL